MIKAVIFDMDGLMFDTIPIWDKVMIDLLRSYGKEFNKEIKLKVYSVRQDECVNYFIRELGINETPEYLMNHMNLLFKTHVKDVRVMPGLLELLDYLEMVGIEKAIATTSLTKDVNILVFEMKDRFIKIVCGDDVVYSKPEPDIYNKVIDILGYLPSECIALEDSLNGVKSGKAAGCYTIAVPNEHSKGAEFNIADLVVESLYDVIDVVEKKINKEFGE